MEESDPSGTRFVSRLLVATGLRADAPPDPDGWSSLLARLAGIFPDQAIARRERYLEAVVEMQTRLLSTHGDELGAYNHALAPLGEASGASRVYLFENHRRPKDGALLLSQRAEWCAPGIRPEIDNPVLQSLPYDDFVPRWSRVLGRGDQLELTEDEYDEQEREILSPQGILSVLVLPLKVDGEFTGFIGFDNCISKDRWSPLEVNLLSAAATQIGLLLAQRRAQRVEAAARAELSKKNEELQLVREQLLASNDALEERVRARTADLAAKNASLAEALATVRRTQERLVQTEKMASLGLLMAGIAHELKNPLNFVNNFAEISLEFAEEIEASAESAHHGVIADELLPEIAKNIRSIHSHGKRANAIINAMLMHSRDQPEQPSKTDLNELLRSNAALAYHGFRTSHPGFEAQFFEDVGEGLDAVHLAAQEIARIVVNLVANSCHSLHQRAKQAHPDYRATIQLHTRRIGTSAILKICDNGTGMPDSVLRRVFDPFFTTKPPGEGTGLGLSLCYDIAVKQLGGELSVASTPGEQTEFTLKIPIAPTTAHVSAQ